MLQVTQTAQDGIQMTYGYSATQNNGKVASATDATLGETVNYTYDLLNRLASAAATDNAWGDAYVYDGYGNLLQKNVTAGSAPSLLQTVNVGNNQINTTQRDTYDANGNQTGTYSFAGVVFQYDIENRVVAIQGEGAVYAYNAQNQRVWRAATVSGKTTEVFYFYGIDGKMIQSYAPTYPVYQGETYMALGTEEQGLYFAGRLVGRSSGLGSLEAVSTDGIGTARWDNSLNGLEAWFYPWGEERGTVTADDRVKFATYRRDSESSLDYAGNRYYDNVTGRFMTADPYLANGGGPGNPTDPQSWNRYAYTRGDPVNRFDPWGTCDTSGDTATSVTVCASGDPVQTQSVGSGASGGVFYFSTSGFPQAHTGWDQSHESQVELVGIDNALYKASVDCLKEQVGNTISAALAAAAGLAGQNWVSTAGKFAGATSGTSLISQFLSDVLPQRIPVSLPTLTNAGIKFTPVLGRILGRWVPIVGYVFLAYDYKAFTDCVDSKIQAAAKEAAGLLGSPHP